MIFTRKKENAEEIRQAGIYDRLSTQVTEGIPDLRARLGALILSGVLTEVADGSEFPILGEEGKRFSGNAAGWQPVKGDVQVGTKDGFGRINRVDIPGDVTKHPDLRLEFALPGPDGTPNPKAVSFVDVTSSNGEVTIDGRNSSGNMSTSYGITLSPDRPEDSALSHLPLSDAARGIALMEQVTRELAGH